MKSYIFFFFSINVVKVSIILLRIKLDPLYLRTEGICSWHILCENRERLPSVIFVCLVLIVFLSSMVSKASPRQRLGVQAAKKSRRPRRLAKSQQERQEGRGKKPSRDFGERDQRRRTRGSTELDGAAAQNLGECRPRGSGVAETRGSATELGGAAML